MPTLTPRALLAFAPLDAELVPGWRLDDVGWTRDRRALRLEVVGAEHRTLRIPSGPALMVDGSEIGDAARRELAARGLTGPITIARPTPAELIAPIAPEPPPAVASTPDDPLLQAELANYARHCGVAPVPVTDGLRYPAPVTDALLGALRPVDHRILERRAHRRAIRDLGFHIDADGVLRTVPTPAAFRRRAQALGLDPPVRPELRWIRGSQAGPDWLETLTTGVFPVGVPRAWSLRIPLVRAPISTLAHDLGFHCLPLAFAGKEAWAALIAPLGTDRRADVVRWMEGPVTNACWEAWAGVDAPAELPAAIAAAWSDLRAP